MNHQISQALQGRRAYQLGQIHAAEDMSPRDIQDFMEKRRDFFIYDSDALPIVAAGNVTDTIAIEADSNFVLQKLAYYATGTAAAEDITTDPTTVFTSGLTNEQRLIPPVAVQITDTGSGRQLMNNPIPIPSFFGTGQLPFVLPNPRLFLRNTTIQVSYTSLDATNDWNIRLAFIGYKIYTTA